MRVIGGGARPEGFRDEGRPSCRRHERPETRARIEETAMLKVSICPVCQDWVLDEQKWTANSAGERVHLDCAREHGRPAYRRSSARDR